MLWFYLDKLWSTNFVVFISKLDTTSHVDHFVPSRWYHSIGAGSICLRTLSLQNHDSRWRRCSHFSVFCSSAFWFWFGNVVVVCGLLCIVCVVCLLCVVCCLLCVVCVLLPVLRVMCYVSVVCVCCAVLSVVCVCSVCCVCCVCCVLCVVFVIVCVSIIKLSDDNYQSRFQTDCTVFRHSSYWCVGAAAHTQFKNRLGR
jgi:hypothetical protein